MKRIISLLLSLFLVVCVLPLSAAADEGQAVAILYADGNTSATGTEYTDLQEAFKQASEGSCVKLMSDVSVTSLSYDESSLLYYGIEMGQCAVFDMNGYTLTITFNGLDANSMGTVAGLHAFSGKNDKLTIQNGEIILSAGSGSTSSDSVFSFAILTEGKPNFTLENVVMTATGTPVSYGITDIAKDGSFEEMNYQLTNCVVKLGESVPAAVSGAQLMVGLVVPPESLPEGWNDTVNLTGDYQCLEGAYSKNIFKYKDEDKITIGGVTSTVITSDATTAVIVQDGNAYLYDTLQEAVDAAAKRSSTGDGDQQEVTINLLKTPEENDTEINYPFDDLKDTTVKIQPLNKDDTNPPSTEDITFVTEDGTTVVLGEDGVVKPVTVEGISVSPSSITLYSNTTPNTATVTATVTPANAATVTWTSSDPSVATVDGNGVVKAVGNGTANITATAGGKTATCVVTVRTYTPPVITDPTYPPEITESENGSVSTSPARPEQGDKVTITTEPDEGYKVDTVIVVDEDGDRVTVTSAGDGKYIFTQPKGEVTITVTFVWDNPFSDVPMDAWYTDAIEYVEVNGLMDGLPGGLFAPSKELTRAEAVQILYNLEGQPTVTGDSTFTDLTDDWYVNAITWAEINGVVDGYGDGTFQPNDTVTREEFAQMMYNYTAFKGLDTSATADLVSKFPDGNEVGAWAETAMEWANGNELINGHDDGTLDPQGIAIRAQAASILMRFDLNLVKAD